ncbi:hypothetical protein CQW23_23665 [Capsicum baccatum]|uniref:DCD domain-containing protein n=1 Tax=Capsicum baccatum TaxID=33114 RepID=A0A2G2VSL9_CAPBA|nr:hypothetical protein CQW23_23665 [Capsicum baccatum]
MSPLSPKRRIDRVTQFICVLEISNEFRGIGGDLEIFKVPVGATSKVTPYPFRHSAQYSQNGLSGTWPLKWSCLDAPVPYSGLSGTGIPVEIATGMLPETKMGERRRKQTYAHNSAPASPYQAKYVRGFRNLPRDQLGGVIFGCTETTIRECLEKQLFGLPAQHFSYVKNVNPGLPVFLFNYSDRKLHGIFEAASSGQMNINPYAFTSGDSGKTLYPAQVQIRVRLHCESLPENTFKQIIFDNYYNTHHFWFELDLPQSSKLTSQLSFLVYVPSSTPYYPENPRSIIRGSPANDKIAESRSFEPRDLKNKSSSSADFQAALDEKDFIYMKLKELALQRARGQAEEGINAGISDNNDVSTGQAAFLEPQPPGEEKSEEGTCDLQLKELKAITEELTRKVTSLEQKLVNAGEDIKMLKSRCLMFESHNPSRTHDVENVAESENIVNHEAIIIAGGYDGHSWLSALDSYVPLNDVLCSLKPMSSVRSLFAIANLSRELYVFGGKSGTLWINTESYNPADNKWTVHHCLNERNGSLAGATWKGNIFAIGGGNGSESFSAVQMYDPQIGRWIPSRSMWQKRFALGAVELNGALYTVGGYDGENYLATTERFDPRKHAWTKIESMSTKRGSHALVPFGGKLYALGGDDGSQMVPSIEIFDPCRGTWMLGEPMKYSRGYSTAAVLKESIYVIGGVQSDDEIVDMIECYKDDQGWETTNLRAVGKRCLSSAIVLDED